MTLLDVSDLNVSYGAIKAVTGISFHVDEGEIVSLIGANGAGKSTTLLTISGLIKPESGTISFSGEQLPRDPSKIVSAGISQVPEGRHIFPGLTVLENLQMGAFLRHDRDEIRSDYDRVFDHFPVLKQRRNQDAATLSGGEQQMLAMGRAMMARPKLMLLDEPSMGLAPLFIKEIFRIIKQIKEEGTTVLLIEQNARTALAIADRGYVLETGNITMSGTGKELLNDPAVKKAYLGG
ncbi:ABC transporter ATP-binding protein [Xylocopilactobacillus apis]|uniref:ABC transporter ATP-binding protein n=1 Tax=Xylocopilactobacillus apis TaxID=2932183 RepID=A0AAU9D2M9_9LACO|nr:ABC transporter ATP-binding protein [Xylocopilactobacillus apis]BDR55645.1 ABC transporter ATP-binding protein [Xylocopilactobacillus apis]